MPIRILSKGRDAYIIAGYVEKKGTLFGWTERYYVLTQTHLYSFKKERNIMYGEQRSMVPTTSIINAQQMDDGRVFEIHFDKRKKVLRAATDHEAKLWVQSVRDLVHTAGINSTGGIHPPIVGEDDFKVRRRGGATGSSTTSPIGTSASARLAR